MKKIGIIAMAFAMLLGMSQCKKENTSASNDEVVKVPITLNVSGNSGSRVAVTPETGVVTFENGDVIHVVSNGVYVGTMTYNGTVFSGEITEPTEGQKLQFYFLGNKTPEFNADNTECSVVISDQTEYLPVISYAPSRENYQIGKTDYNATLLNKCALVKFDVTTASEAATCIVGMNNKVTVNLATNEFAYDMDGEGIITLAAGNGERWGILLPQDEITKSEVVSLDGLYVGECGIVPDITENDYLTEGIAVTVTLPEGAVKGLFTINANGDQVYYSKGNLQYQASTNTWRFAESQWNCIGDGNSNISETYDGWIDLFGWGTSGYNHGANCYQPWSTSENYSDYYVYGAYNNNLYDQNGQADWGVNAIANGSNVENRGWRTPSNSEWGYLFNTRSTASGIRYAKGCVNGVNGIILLPDNWNHAFYELNNTNESDSGYVNIITLFDWTIIFESNGAVFLPAGGYREGTTIWNCNESGSYWSATFDNYNYAYNVWVLSTLLYPQDGGDRYCGHSVRLIIDVE